MAEHIKCRHCESPDCRGCNIHTLAVALEHGYFNSLMDGNRAIHIETDVRANVKGEWIEDMTDMFGFVRCSECGRLEEYPQFFCPHCGADLREDKDE